MKTLREYLDAGYHISEAKYQRGYISRRTDMSKQPVLVAGGNRRGALYVLAPCLHTSRYCQRLYLTK